MKLINILKLSGVALLVVLSTSSCDSKKKKAEAEAQAAAEAAAQAAAEKAKADSIALASRVFELAETVTAVADTTVAESAEAYTEAVKANMAATEYGSSTFAMPIASVTYSKERCDLNADTKALLQEFLNTYNATDKTAVILIEPYASDSSDKEYNKAIAVERANLVAGWFYAYQVPMKNVKVVCPCKSRKIDGSKRRVNVSIK